VVANVQGSPDLEINVGDRDVSLVCVSIDGDVLWDQRLVKILHQLKHLL
jgi:hypothetical protein